MESKTYVSKLSNMTPEEKYIHQRTLDKAVKKRYYASKGRVLQAIKLRCKKYELTKDYFECCNSVEDVNNKVNEFLKDKGLPIQAQIRRKTDYKEQSTSRDVKLPSRFKEPVVHVDEPIEFVK